MSDSESSEASSKYPGKECPVCHTIFYKKSPLAIYCSIKCKDKVHNNTSKEAKACLYCGKIHNRAGPYCCRACFGKAFAANLANKKIHNEMLGIVPEKKQRQQTPKPLFYKEKECPVCHVLHRRRSPHCSYACGVIGRELKVETQISHTLHGEKIREVHSKSLDAPYRAKLSDTLGYLAAEDYSVSIPDFPELPDGYMLNEFE